MKHSQHELISAYFDGELVGSELQAAEQLLQDSAEARAELAGYRKLSAALKQSCQTELRVDLTASVMQEVGLASPTTSNSRAVVTAQSTQVVISNRSSRLRQIVLVTSSCAAALLLAFLVNSNLNRPVADPNNVQIASNGDSKKSNQNVDGTKSTVVTPQTNGTGSENGLTGNSDNEHPVGRSPIEVASNSNTVGKGQEQPIGTEPKSRKPRVVPLQPDDLPVALIEDLKKTPPGTMVRFLKHGDQEVRVFHLMVVDVNEGAESLQLILSAQQISNVDGRPLKAQPDMVGVYVQANQSQLEKVLAELTRDSEPQFVAMAVDAPMPLAKVDGIMKGGANPKIAQSVSVKETELKAAGIRQIDQAQIVASRRNRGGGYQQGVFAQNGPDRSAELRKVLIVLEKASSELTSGSRPGSN